ncbi:hypothetical protein JS756_06095 [Streptomyces actuosus]|uniref:Uncharacterized protein n=1 Tax=Streptomyces actuosus TaxID=1885 RepID=A0ABS2VKQ9_STRAS|nr:hypothetical protein [Streptomyces actuosus]MBN0043683.1 hypothetical protein [Streptomyces actuosus]
MIHVYVLPPRKPPIPEASSNHSHTTLLHSTAYRVPAVRGRPARISTAKAGSSHTRWCTQVTGLTRQAASPVSARAARRSPATTARRARRAHTPSTASTATAHRRRCGSPSRARTPCRDWYRLRGLGGEDGRGEGEDEHQAAAVGARAPHAAGPGAGARTA